MAYPPSDDILDHRRVELAWLYLSQLNMLCDMLWAATVSAKLRINHEDLIKPLDDAKYYNSKLFSAVDHAIKLLDDRYSIRVEVVSPARKTKEIYAMRQPSKR